MYSLKHELRRRFDEVSLYDNNYNETAMSDGVIQNIINLSVLNPAAFGNRLLSVIVVRSCEARQKLYKLSGHRQQVLASPVSLIVLYDCLHGFISDTAYGEIQLPARSDIDSNGYSERLEVAKLAELSIMYASKYFGIESHVVKRDEFEEIKKEFGIGIEKEIALITCLGHFINSPSPFPEAVRRNFSEAAREV